MTENDLISYLTAKIQRRKKNLILGIGDDASLLRIGKKEIAISCDALVEDIHFRRRSGPWDLWGSKAAGAALSDMAAMGASPKWAWADLHIPASMNVAAVRKFYRAYQKKLARFGVTIAGGNISRSPKGFSATTTIWGETRAEWAMRRDRARAGETVYLSGRLGKRGWDVQPRIKLGLWLSAQGCRSAIDISDGLLQDLGHIAQASRVKIILEAEKIPHAGPSLLQSITRGEDYELAFTLRKNISGEGFRPVGKVVAGKPQVVVLQRGRPLSFSKKGFQHRVG